MTQSEIEQAIYEKYIEPTKKSRKHSMGIEIEMPVVNMSGEPVSEEICIQVAKKFREHYDFIPNGKDDQRNVYSMIHKESGDDLSFDCAYSNLELSMGKGENLFVLKERFENYYTFLNEQFAKYGYTLTGMGINPHYNINHNQPIPNERYRMLFHHLHTYKNYQGDPEQHFTDRADFGTFTSASQVQIDVDYENLIDTINTFSLLEPYKAILFGNSYMGEYPDYTMVRNLLWEHSMQGYNPHNIGMFEHKIHSVEELVSYIMTTSIYCTMREGRYVNFTPMPVAQYFMQDAVKGEFYNGKEYEEITIVPEVADLEHLRSFKFEDLTFRGTIEYRSTCCQPVSDSMTVAAFHMGLLQCLPEVKEYLENDRALYAHGYSATELQKMMSKMRLPDFVEEDHVKEALLAILNLAKKGLQKRNLGEERLLDPLYQRAKKLSNPAKEMILGLKEGKSMDDFIHTYGSLSGKEEIKCQL